MLHLVNIDFQEWKVRGATPAFVVLLDVYLAFIVKHSVIVDREMRVVFVKPQIVFMVSILVALPEIPEIFSIHLMIRYFIISTFAPNR